jgi:hypothetical protein
MHRGPRKGWPPGTAGVPPALSIPRWAGVGWGGKRADGTSAIPEAIRNERDPENSALRSNARRRAPELVRLVRFERTLCAPSTHSLCLLGYRRVKDKGWRTRLDSNQRGAGPGRLRGGCRRSLGYWSKIADLQTGGHGGTRTHGEALTRQPG